MDYIYLIGAALLSAAMSVVNMAFKRRNWGAENTSSFYNLLVSISAFVTWGVFFALDGSFDIRVILYSATYGIFYAMALIGLFKALEYGSASLTSFIKQLSLIAVSIWGFIFWKTPLTVTVVIGLVLIVIALYLCFKPDRNHAVKTSVKWVVFALLLLVGNAGCSIIQKYQQAAFDTKYGSTLMFFGIGFATIFCLAKYLKDKKPDFKMLSKSSLVLPVVSGISSALLNNFIILMLSTALSESVIFPVIAVGGMILTTLFSVLVYKERLGKLEWAGLAVGAVALVFLNV
ncbi:MAG: EamA family transporter [Oscillospiraceae bacterium]|nr:EamA family transporter [Oscillospiraceae bacterium]